MEKERISESYEAEIEDNGGNLNGMNGERGNVSTFFDFPFLRLHFYDIVDEENGKFDLILIHIQFTRIHQCTTSFTFFDSWHSSCSIAPMYTIPCYNVP